MPTEHLTKAEFDQFALRVDDGFDRIENAMSKHRDDHAREDERETEAHGVLHTRIDEIKANVAAQAKDTAVELEKAKSNHNMLAMKVGILIAVLLTFKDVILDFVRGVGP